MLLIQPRKIWNLYLFNIDLFEGLNNLINFQKKYSNSIVTVNYENLLCKPEKVVSQIYSYLGIEAHNDDLDIQSNQFLNGHMGDRLNSSKEKSFDLSSIEKWKTVINNPIRKFWCIRYIKWIGKDRLNAIGYDFDTIMKNLNAVDAPINIEMFKDTYRIIFGLFYCLFEFTIVKDNFKRLPRIFQIYAKT